MATRSDSTDFGVWSCRPWLGWWIESANNRLESVSLYRSITICCVAMPTGVVRDRILRPLHTRHPSTNIHWKKTCFLLNFKPQKILPVILFWRGKIQGKAEWWDGRPHGGRFVWLNAHRTRSVAHLSPPPFTCVCGAWRYLNYLWVIHYQMPAGGRGLTGYDALNLAR